MSGILMLVSGMHYGQLRHPGWCVSDQDKLPPPLVSGNLSRHHLSNGCVSKKELQPSTWPRHPVCLPKPSTRKGSETTPTGGWLKSRGLKPASISRWFCFDPYPTRVDSPQATGQPQEFGGQATASMQVLHSPPGGVRPEE